MPGTAWLSLLLLAQALSAAQKVEGPSVVVLRIPSRQGLTDNDAELLTGALTSSVRAQKRFARVVGAAQVEQVLSVEQARQMIDCTEGSCLSEIAGALGTDYVLACSVGHLAEAWLINCTLTNARTAEVASALSRTVKGTGTHLVAEAFDPVMERLLDEAGLGFLERTRAVAPEEERSSRAAVDPRKTVYQREDEPMDDDDDDAGDGGGGKSAPAGFRPWHVTGAVAGCATVGVPACLFASLGTCISIPVSEGLRLQFYNQGGWLPGDPRNQAFLAYTCGVAPLMVLAFLVPVPLAALVSLVGGVVTGALFYLDRTLLAVSDGLAERARVKRYRKRRCRGAECEERRGINP